MTAALDNPVSTAVRSACHLELRDAYDPANTAFSTWLETGTHPSIADRPAWAAWHRTVVDATARGVHVRRARVISEPVSSYIRWEWEVTPILNTAAGEDVRWLPRRRAVGLALPATDHWLIDGQRVVFAYFSGDGKLIEHEGVDDPAVVKLCAEAFDAVWSRAIPHDQYSPA